MTYKSAIKYVAEQIELGNLDKNDCYREIKVIAVSFGRDTADVSDDVEHLTTYGSWRPKRDRRAGLTRLPGEG